MILILVSIILLESVMFGIVFPEQKNKNRLVIMGALITIFLTIARAVHSDVLIWVGFIGGHIVLFAIYLICYYHLITQIEKENLKTLFTEYVKIPTFFYSISIVAVLYTLIAGINSDETFTILIILLFDCIAALYTFAENKKLNHMSNELTANMEQQNLKQYVYRKNALVAVYATMLSISAGIFYICMLDVNQNITTLIFVLEFVVNMIIYASCYHKVKVKFMPEDNCQYSKWQLLVPKRLGIGYTFNFSSPLTYIVLGILIVGVIISLL